MPKFSAKKPLTVFVAVLAVLILGVVAYTRMTPDLLPNMNFPYVIIVTSDPGASPEAVESEITRPMEQSMATLEQIKSVSSTSQGSASMVMLEFEEDVNMDSILLDIQQKISVLEGTWGDTVSTPYVLEINPSMLPVQVAAVAYDGKDVEELSTFVEDTLLNQLAGISGVASVDATGVVERELHVLLNQEKLDALSTRLADAIGAQMDAAIAQLQAMLFGIGSHDLEVLVQLAGLEFILGDGHGIKPTRYLHDEADFFIVGVLVEKQLGLRTLLQKALADFVHHVVFKKVLIIHALHDAGSVGQLQQCRGHACIAKV